LPWAAKIQATTSTDPQALYDAFERRVLPAWADRAKWTRMMIAIVKLARQGFRAECTVRDYFTALHVMPEALAKLASTPPFATERATATCRVVSGATERRRLRLSSDEEASTREQAFFVPNLEGPHSRNHLPIMVKSISAVHLVAIRHREVLRVDWEQSSIRCCQPG
jgi:hypothetical protein